MLQSTPSIGARARACGAVARDHFAGTACAGTHRVCRGFRSCRAVSHPDRLMHRPEENRSIAAFGRSSGQQHQVGGTQTLDPQPGSHSHWPAVGSHVQIDGGQLLWQTKPLGQPTTMQSSLAVSGQPGRPHKLPRQMRGPPSGEWIEPGPPGPPKPMPSPQSTPW
jgi:hypothetical protein